MHLPFQFTGASMGSRGMSSEQRNTDEDVPDAPFPAELGWQDTRVELDEFKVILSSDDKVADKIKCTRYRPDRSKVTTLDAIFTSVKIGEDWRCVSRSPFNIEMFE